MVSIRTTARALLVFGPFRLCRRVGCRIPVDRRLRSRAEAAAPEADTEADRLPGARHRRVLGRLRRAAAPGSPRGNRHPRSPARARARRRGRPRPFLHGLVAGRLHALPRRAQRDDVPLHPSEQRPDGRQRQPGPLHDRRHVPARPEERRPGRGGAADPVRISRVADEADQLPGLDPGAALQPFRERDSDLAAAAVVVAGRRGRCSGGCSSRSFRSGRRGRACSPPGRSRCRSGRVPPRPRARTRAGAQGCRSLRGGPEVAERRSRS